MSDEKEYRDLIEKEDTECMLHKKMMNTVFYEIRNLEQQLVKMKAAFDDAQRAHALGLQNVYNKFLQIEKRQTDIEELLQSDRVKAMLDAIPNEKTVLRMFEMIDNHPITDLRESIDKVREDLQEMVDRFTF